MTALEKLYKELSDRMKDEPNKKMILGYTIGLIEKYKPMMIEENASKILNTMKAEQPELPAENTVMWWLCRIADDEVRRKAVGNCLVDEWNGEKESAGSANEALYYGFMWAEGNEIAGYWSNLYNSEIPLLPSPEWKEYLELKTKP